MDPKYTPSTAPSSFHRKGNSTGLLDLKSIKHKGLGPTLSNESTGSKSINHTVKQFRRKSAANISLSHSSRRPSHVLNQNYSNVSAHSNLSRKISRNDSQNFNNTPYPKPIPENLPYPSQYNQPFLPPSLPVVRENNKAKSSKGCNLSESVQIGSKIFQLIGTFF